MAAKKHLASIAILVKDRHEHSVDVQRILTEHGNVILGRMGINPSRSCVEHCTGIISIIVEGTAKEIKDLTKKLDAYYGIVAKTNIMTD
ncbi:CopG family transcriptional regulator [Candidatus Parcubacteria bacterium]|jgi:putative iron-only hydrogenase system regulator|nr:CopG family transcriptional regulator [Candidatus Parcubacteria bacterium]